MALLQMMKNWLAAQKGQVFIEYALVICLIVIVVAFVLVYVGWGLADIFWHIYYWLGSWCGCW